MKYERKLIKRHSVFVFLLLLGHRRLKFNRVLESEKIKEFFFKFTMNFYLRNGRYLSGKKTKSKSVGKEFRKRSYKVYDHFLIYMTIKRRLFLFSITS